MMVMAMPENTHIGTQNKQYTPRASLGHNNNAQGAPPRAPKPDDAGETPAQPSQTGPSSRPQKQLRGRGQGGRAGRGRSRGRRGAPEQDPSEPMGTSTSAAAATSE